MGNSPKLGYAVRFCLLLTLAGLAFAQNTSGPPVNRDAAIGAKFEDQIASYMKVHQKAQSGLTTPKKTDSAAQIAGYQHELAAKIRALRPDAKQGEIFTPDVSALFRRLVRASLNSSDGEKIRKSYQHAEPEAVKGVRLDVNQAYPDSLPLQSMPPSLLLNLPKLPKELEYRFVGTELTLRDIPANLIVDVLPDISTPEKK